MDEDTSFGYWVRRCRKTLNLTQDELARRVGCATITIRKIEQDERRPSRQVAERLAEVLDLPRAEREAFVKSARAGWGVARLDATLAPLRSTLDVTRPADPHLAVRPTGTVTFLFTDLESSTRLWEHHAQAMPGALARHDACLRDAVAAHHGTIVKQTGDGMHAAFGRAGDALAAALAAQRALQREAWGDVTVRARMALHTGRPTSATATTTDRW
jgi:class 3 adenylate cyclase